MAHRIVAHRIVTLYISDQRTMIQACNYRALSVFADLHLCSYIVSPL